MEAAPETLLRRLVRQQNIEPYKQFCREFERAARSLGERDNDPEMRQATVGERQYARWLTGEVRRQPHPLACRVLHHMFACSARELLAPAPRPAADPACVTPSRGAEFDDEELMTSAYEAATHAGEAAAQALTAEAIVLMRTEVERIARSYHRIAPYQVFISAKRMRELAGRRMPLTHRPDQSRDLYLIAGQASALMAAAAFDLGAREASQTLTYAAMMYARPIDYHPLMSWCSGTLALLAYWDHRPGEALLHVGAAQQWASSGTARSRLHSIAGRAYAHLGQAEDTRRELIAAEFTDRSMLDDLHDGIGGEFGFSEERAQMSAGTSWAVLGHGDGVVSCSGRALALVRARPPAQRSVKVESEAAADLAFGHLLQQELEAAGQVLEAVFAVPPEHRVDGLMRRVTNVGDMLASRPFPRARLTSELGDRLVAFGRESARTLLPASAPRALDQ
ncbi:DNA-binding protein [Streptoverticillium reticulum]|uniref:DNA-binding protein n=1 Tax=Streptoverticillium reticulum TaxID=1433415 RepID=UPI0039BED630